MQAVHRHGWKFGKDTRRHGGIALISPRGTVYEFRANPPRARKQRDFALSDS